MLLTDPDNREYIPSVGSRSGGGKLIPPILILYRILILEKWAEENDHDEDILLWWRNDETDNMIILFAYSLVRNLVVSVASRPNRVRKLKKICCAESPLSAHNQNIFILNANATHARISKQIHII